MMNEWKTWKGVTVEGGWCWKQTRRLLTIRDAKPNWPCYVN